MLLGLGLGFLRVSIHAPTRGATHVQLGKLPIDEFQSTHPRGVRRHVQQGKLPTDEFQSTHPRGVRPHILQNTEY